MFILSLFLTLWTLAVLAAAIMSCLAVWVGFRFELRQAEILVANASTVHAVDVTREMLLLLASEPRKVQLLPQLMTIVLRADLREALATCETSPGDPLHRVRRAPLCFLDVRYAVLPGFLLALAGRKPSRTHRCLYPIYSFQDYICYPPKCDGLWRAQEGASASSVLNAILTLRYEGEATKQLSCKVTDRIRLLEGPKGDFHRGNHPGYQLRKHILRAVLMPDIRTLRDLVDQQERRPTASSSSGSLKSLASQLPAISIRFQFRSQDHRVEAMTL